MASNNTVIVDYTLGNLYSVKRAFQKVGCDPVISSKREDIVNARKIVLPGVGAFSAGVKGLEGKELFDVIKDSALEGKPILGICLGMQLLMTQSEEDGLHNGLDLIKGKVVRFDNPEKKGAFKIPHYGWESVLLPDLDGSFTKELWQQTILDGTHNNSYFYFIHSYFVVTESPVYSIGMTNYGLNTFASVIRKENITGCQFHPEKSGDAGLHVINNFVKQKG